MTQCHVFDEACQLNLSGFTRFYMDDLIGIDPTELQARETGGGRWWPPWMNKVLAHDAPRTRVNRKKRRGHGFAFWWVALHIKVVKINHSSFAVIHPAKGV